MPGMLCLAFAVGCSGSGSDQPTSCEDGQTWDEEYGACLETVVSSSTKQSLSDSADTSTPTGGKGKAK